MSGASYELWELDTGNLVGGYETEAAALVIVRRSIERYGRESVATLGLAREARGRTTTIAVGDALATRALAAEASPARPVVPA